MTQAIMLTQMFSKYFEQTEPLGLTNAFFQEFSSALGHSSETKTQLKEMMIEAAAVCQRAPEMSPSLSATLRTIDAIKACFSEFNQTPLTTRQQMAMLYGVESVDIPSDESLEAWLYSQNNLLFNQLWKESVAMEPATTSQRIEENRLKLDLVTVVLKITSSNWKSIAKAVTFFRDFNQRHGTALSVNLFFDVVMSTRFTFNVDGDVLTSEG